MEITNGFVGAWLAAVLLIAAAPSFGQEVSVYSGADLSTADAAPAGAQIDPAQQAGDRFVPASPTMNRPATLELRGDATVFGADIHLKQLCRWSNADAPTMTPVADLAVAHFGRSNREQRITLDQLRATLQDAGVNLAAVRFEGAMSCTVTRGDFDAARGEDTTDSAALQQWIASASASGSGANGAGMSSTAPMAPVKPGPIADAVTPNSLRDLLLKDISQRLNLPLDVLDVSFDPKDQAVLNLAEPNFHFSIRPRLVRDLGDVSWDVTILTGGPLGGSGGGSQRVGIRAQARAWQNQFVTVSAVSYGAVLRDSDVESRRVLIDSLPDAEVLNHEQIVGQQAARDLQPGIVMTARLVQPVPLAKPGQYVTVTLNSGTVQIRTVAVAIEGGSYGQSIKVKDEATREVFEVTLVGPQQATMGAAPVQTASAR